MTGIIDYDAGNIKSVMNAFEFIGEKTELVHTNLAKYDRIVLPGVGAFGEAMQKLKSRGLDEEIKLFVASGKPFLGICLGMQLLFEKSDEFGENLGLGLIKGEVVRFKESEFTKKLKIPHVGWNSCEFTRKSKINKGLGQSAYLYFVHSYHVVCDDKFALSKTFYGYEFVSAVEKDNVFGFQPHPEKSHENGLKILKNFTEI